VPGATDVAAWEKEKLELIKTKDEAAEKLKVRSHNQNFLEHDLPLITSRFQWKKLAKQSTRLRAFVSKTWVND
jgi:hypothetical protein